MAEKYGLIYEPEVREIVITKELKHVVLGSDGLFDKVRPEEMADILKIREKGAGKMEVCKLITELAKSRWIEYSDDISGIVVYL
jgi:serine/threonine protein phosphatase PrpC